MSKNLSWNQRWAIVDHYGPTDAQICTAFNVTQGELTSARQLRDAGQFIPDTSVDVDKYAHLFSDADGATSTVSPSKKTSTTTTTTKTDKPLTATKKVKEPGKRGRKGNKIKTAFSAIPSKAVPAEEFAAQHNVSIAVLRQSKRFDNQPETGVVHVKKIRLNEDDDAKTLCIWRSPTDDT